MSILLYLMRSGPPSLLCFSCRTIARPTAKLRTHHPGALEPRTIGRCSGRDHGAGSTVARDCPSKTAASTLRHPRDLQFVLIAPLALPVAVRDDEPDAGLIKTWTS